MFSPVFIQVFMTSNVFRGLILALFFAFSSALPHSPILHAEENTGKNFTSITPEDVNQIENLHERAADLMAQHDFRGAVNVYSEILLTEPDDENAYTSMGQAYMVLGDFGRAKDAFQNAIHINPDNELAAYGLKKIADPDFS